MDLTLDYDHDWRAHAALFRINGGASALAKQAVSLRARQLVWVSMWIAAAALAFHYRWWLLFVPVSLFTLILVAYSLALRNLGRKAAFGVRANWRQRPARRIHLEISDAGLREVDGDVSSFAPWHTVKSYWLFRDVLSVELTNGQAALIPLRKLRAGSFQSEVLVEELERRSVPRRDVGEKRAGIIDYLTAHAS
jgi:hypothetical protein